MRLVNVDTLQLEEFVDERSAPPYAILSHRWGAEELLFSDVRDKSAMGRKKQGLRKLKLSCGQARRHQYAYIWIDTCCIDKTSSAELTEAINSMYRWYQRARKCYVYLSDVDLSRHEHHNQGHLSSHLSSPTSSCVETVGKQSLRDESDHLEHISVHGTDTDTNINTNTNANTHETLSVDGQNRRQSRDREELVYDNAVLRERLRESSWFKRGWTLQELLAPEVVNFYDQNWNEIGTKKTLGEFISTITGIPSDCLQSITNPRRYSIAQRLSWASNRQTTRVEDMAYCLLGLCDVNMPLLYGEGTRAFTRLQEEIIRYSDDESIFAWSDPQPVRDDAFGFKMSRIFNTGLFAKSPAHFSGCRNTVRHEIGYSEKRHPVSLTNLGVSVNLLMIPAAMDTYFALLACRDDGLSVDRAYRRLGMFLRLTGEKDRFERVKIGNKRTAAWGSVLATLQEHIKNPESELVYRQGYVTRTGHTIKMRQESFSVNVTMQHVKDSDDFYVVPYKPLETNTDKVEVTQGEMLGIGNAICFRTVNRFQSFSEDQVTALEVKIGFDLDFRPWLSTREVPITRQKDWWPSIQDRAESILDTSWMDRKARSRSRHGFHPAFRQQTKEEGSIIMDEFSRGRTWRGDASNGLSVLDVCGNAWFHVHRSLDDFSNWNIAITPLDPERPILHPRLTFGWGSLPVYHWSSSQQRGL